MNVQLYKFMKSTMKLSENVVRATDMVEVVRMGVSLASVRKLMALMYFL